MLLQIGPYAGEVLQHGDVETLEESGRTDATELEDLRRVQGAESKDDLLVGRDGQLGRRLLDRDNIDTDGFRATGVDFGNIGPNENV